MKKITEKTEIESKISGVRVAALLELTKDCINRFVRLLKNNCMIMKTIQLTQN